MHLSDACQEVMEDASLREKYPKGLDGNDILNEIRVKHPGAFPLCTVLDVVDEMRKLYG